MPKTLLVSVVFAVVVSGLAFALVATGGIAYSYNASDVDGVRCMSFRICISLIWMVKAMQIDLMHQAFGVFANTTENINA